MLKVCSKEAWQAPAGCGWPQTLKLTWAPVGPDDPHVKGAHFDRIKTNDPRKVQCAQQSCFSLFWGRVFWCVLRFLGHNGLHVDSFLGTRFDRRGNLLRTVT